MSEVGRARAAGALQVEPLGGALGAVVRGLSLKTPLAAERVAELRALLLEQLVLSFPDQHLSADEQRAFARQFGPLERHTEVPKTLDGSDEEVVVIDPEYGVSSVWHFDYDADFNPSGLGTLNMRVCPPRGGDTLFVSAYRVYEHLSQPMRDLLEDLTAVHHNIGNYGRNRDVAEHRLVGVHPETGRKTLVFSGHHVQRLAELSEGESEALIAYLRQIASRPEFSCRHPWQAGTLCLWDNRCVQHYAVHDFDAPRTMYRVTMRAPLPESTPPKCGPAHAA